MNIATCDEKVKSLGNMKIIRENNKPFWTAKLTIVYAEKKVL